MDIPQFAYPLTYQWACELLPCFAIVNNAVINMGAQISFGVPVFNSLDYIPRNGASSVSYTHLRAHET